jgi:hypothetical protein
MIPSVFTKIVVCSIFLIAIFSCSNSEKQKQFTVEEYEAAAKHMDRNLYNLVYNQVSGSSFLSDNKLLYSTTTKNGTTFILVTADSKTKEPAFNHKKLAEALSKELDTEIAATALPISAVSFSDTTNTLHFTAFKQKYLYKVKEHTLLQHPSKRNSADSNEHVSPNGKLAAYIDAYNLWIRDLDTDKSTQLTFDGKQDYGYATNNAGWIKSNGAVLKWSPNSDKIATFQQDARGVGMMYLTTSNVGHPRLEAWKHPLPGDAKIFTIARVIIHLGNKPKTVRLKMDKDFQRGYNRPHCRQK